MLLFSIVRKFSRTIEHYEFSSFQIEIKPLQQGPKYKPLHEELREAIIQKMSICISVTFIQLRIHVQSFICMYQQCIYIVICIVYMKAFL